MSKTKATADRLIIRAIGHPIRTAALEIFAGRTASPNELSRELGEGLSQVSYHVKVLRDCECIQLVKTVPRRGAVEHYYKAAPTGTRAVAALAAIRAA